jgi:hypothetical protein
MDFRGINLHQLHIFRAVAQHQSFSRAAVELYLSQPGVSQQVKMLERNLGLPLLEKNGRSFLPTATVSSPSWTRPAWCWRSSAAHGAAG